MCDAVKSTFPQVLGTYLRYFFTSDSNQLRRIFAQKGLPVTNSGANWCIKALHPSDVSVYSTGIPDGNPLPTVIQNFQMTTTITAPVGEGQLDTWEFNGSLLPHPINFMWWTSSSGIVLDGNTILNTQLEGTTHAAKFLTLLHLAQRWRLSHASVTVYQDGPALADQGEVVVCQPVCLPSCANFSLTHPVLNAVPPTAVYANYNMGAPSAHIYDAEDLPDFESAVTSPNAYAARSKEGCYVPLKLTETCQDWQSESTAVGVTAHGPNDDDSTRCKYWQGLPVYDNALLTSNIFPHWTGNTSGNELTPVCFGYHVDTGNMDYYGDRTSHMLSDGVAHICFRNISRQTSLQLVFRYGIEMQVHPSSVLGPQAKMPPGVDEMAIKTYYSIVRELKDAYPASYNDLGKLWDIISSAAKNAIIPMLGPIAGTALSGVVNFGDAIRTRRKQRKAQKKANRMVSVAPQDKIKSTAVSNTRAMNAAYQPYEPTAQQARKTLKIISATRVRNGKRTVVPLNKVITV